MIYLDSIESVIEAVYLNERLDNKFNQCSILVNPENVKYITGKTIIINILDYSEEDIKTLIENNCKVISRVYSGIEKVEVQPYILRVNSNIQWNGRELPDTFNIQGIIDKEYYDFSLKDYILYFPKIKISNKVREDIKDNYNHLTSLGWALQQVGVNIDTETIFTNLDIIKSKKMIF